MLIFVAAFVFAFEAAAAGLFSVTGSEPAPELDSLFFRTNGWIGADGDYSVAVSSNRTLWFFSDTWLGRIVGTSRTNTTMINNSIGVQTGRGAKSQVEFFWDRQTNGESAAMFRPPDGHGWFWPGAGAIIAGRLHLLLWQMESTGEPGAFGFRNAGVWHCEIANPEETPPAWRLKFQKLPFTELTANRRLIFGSAVLQYGEYLYFYGFEEHPGEKNFGRRMILARVEKEAASDFDHWRFFSDGVWQEDFRRSSPLAPGIATEFSVHFVPALNQFVVVCSDVFLSPDVVAHTAPRPWGPWSGPTTLFRCPEAGWSGSIFCYAGKAHASLSTDGEIVVSYAANSMKLAEVIRDARLYWPRFMHVKLSRSIQP